MLSSECAAYHLVHVHVGMNQIQNTSDSHFLYFGDVKNILISKIFHYFVGFRLQT